MTIKTMDGNTENVASSASANTGITLGAIGLGLGLLNGGLGLFGNGNRAGIACQNSPELVTKSELDLVQQLQAKDIQLAAKDSELALKSSEAYTDKKMVEVYTETQSKINALAAEVRANKDQQAAINANQMALNATENGVLGTMSAQIAQLQSIVTSVVPSSKVCDTGCCCN